MIILENRIMQLTMVDLINKVITYHQRLLIQQLY